jgi:hypothetical protein
MKTDKMGDARGRPRWGSSLVGDPSAIFFGGKRAPGTKPEEHPASEENWGRSFYFCISSLAERLAAARSGQGRAVVPARRSAPLTARTAAKAWAREEKTWFSRMQDLGKTEEQG